MPDIDHLRPDLGRVLCVPPVCGAWFTETWQVADLTPPESAEENLTRAADLLGLTAALSGTEPRWHLRKWIGA